MDGVCQLYEQSLKTMNPGLRSTTYDVQDLFSFVDSVSDLSCLVFNPKSCLELREKRSLLHV